MIDGLIEHLQSSKVCFVSASPDEESFCPAYFGASAMVGLEFACRLQLENQ